jgi:N-acetylglucosamine-6-phosphate deacetylase
MAMELIGMLLDASAPREHLSSHDDIRPSPSGRIRIVDGVIESAAQGDGPTDSFSPAMKTDWLFPGFVDVHCHGGGGAEFASEDSEQIRAAAKFHLDHGTTSILASLPAAPLDRLCRQAAAIARVVAEGDTTIRGLHFEGPFLAPGRRGAQNAEYLLSPDLAVLRRLFDAGDGAAVMITIAPELDGALDLVAHARAMGMCVALGHSDATYEVARAGFEAGATVATHLFNGMRPVHHREPGIAAAALEYGAGLELIADGVHLHAATVRAVDRSARGRWMLVTDAIGAAGAPGDRYFVGDQLVRVHDGVSRVSTPASTGLGSLAGTTLTMDAAVRRAVRDFGIPLEVAVRAATEVPAACLGLQAIAGRLAPGRQADLVRMTPDLKLSGVMTAGQWL